MVNDATYFGMHHAQYSRVGNKRKQGQVYSFLKKIEGKKLKNDCNALIDVKII